MDDIQRNVIGHSQRDDESLLGRMWAKRNEWASQQPSFWGQVAAMFREAVKDVRQTIMETYFGKPEHMPEPGAPGNPTQQQVTVEQGNFHGYSQAVEDARFNHPTHDEGRSR